MRPPGPASTTNARFTARDQAILRFIAKARWCHARAVMTAFGMSYDMVHRRLRAMVGLGLIRSSQRENRTHKAEPAFYSIRERGVAELQRLYNDDVVRVGGLPRQKDHHRAVVELHGAFLGAKCTVLGNVRVGKGATIAAAALVNKEVPDGYTAVGVPARLIAPQGESTRTQLDLRRAT